MKYSRVDKLLERVSQSRPLTSGELARLRDEFLVDFTYNSNAIEGSTLTLQETALILNEGITIAEKPLKEHLEAIGHKDAFFYIEELVKEKLPLTEKNIKNIHSLILMDKPLDRGVYRRIPVRIMGADNVPPEPWEIPKKMEDLLFKHTEMISTLHPIERISLFHLQFEQIHPFIDGNGRMGRMLINLELMKAGYPVINVKFSDRRKYYECFASYYQTGGNPEGMISLIENYLIEALEDYLKILSR